MFRSRKEIGRCAMATERRAMGRSIARVGKKVIGSRE
jgi:hypothetical protein